MAEFLCKYKIIFKQEFHSGMLHILRHKFNILHDIGFLN